MNQYIYRDGIRKERQKKHNNVVGERGFEFSARLADQVVAWLAAIKGSAADWYRLHL